MLHFLLGKPLYWWPDFANHRNDSMHYVTELHMMQFIWNFCTCLRSIRESEGISFWFWTDRIKHTCYIEIIQDQYAIDNFSYCFNRLLCALGKGWGLWQILYYISWNWWDKFFFQKLSTYTKYWHLNTHRYELNFSYSFIDMSMAFEC